MTQALFSDVGWSGVAGRLPAGFDLVATAREHGAFARARGVGSAEDLLRLALIYGATSLSLRGTAAWAETTGLAELSDVAPLPRRRLAGVDRRSAVVGSNRAGDRGERRNAPCSSR
jgi:hypothetical protein